MIKLLSRVLALAGAYRRQVILGFVFGFCEALFNLLTLAAIFVAFLWGAERLGLIVLLLLLGLGGRIVFRYLVARFQSGTGFLMTADKRLELARLLKNAPMSFYDSHDRGDLAACLTTDLSFVEMYVMFILDKIVNGFLMTLVSGVFLFVFDWRIGLCAVLALLPALVAFAVLERSGKNLGALRQNTQAELGAAVLEYAKGIMTAKAYDLGNDGASRLKRAFRASNLRSFRVERGFVCGVSAFQVLVRLASVVMVLAVAGLALAGELTLAVALTLLVASLTLFNGFEESVSKIPMLRIMEASLDRIDRIVQLPQEAAQEAHSAPEKFSIQFDNVSFGYDAQQLVLENLSFTIPARTTAAIVGRSGSGKSTLMKLIARFYDCSMGTVRIGGIDVREIPPAQLFSYVSVVFQQVYLFEDTIAANIRFGKPDASMEEVIDAARRACCYDFITALPDGFETMVGEGGHTLSGGQRQRISIARAILMDAPIVLLDEATSSVDAENEAMIQQALDALVADRTVVTIAHNLAAVSGADRILVLDEGQLVAQGDHTTLLAEDGVYRTLWEMSQRVHSWNVAAGS